MLARALELARALGRSASPRPRPATCRRRGGRGAGGAAACGAATARSACSAWASCWPPAIDAAAELAAEGIDATVWDVRVVSPPDPAMLADAAATPWWSRPRTASASAAPACSCRRGGRRRGAPGAGPPTSTSASPGPTWPRASRRHPGRPRSRRPGIADDRPPGPRPAGPAVDPAPHGTEADPTGRPPTATGWRQRGGGRAGPAPVGRRGGPLSPNDPQSLLAPWARTKSFTA